MARRADLAKIHIAKKQLCMDDDTYRDALFNAVGKRSASDCSDRQLKKALAHFYELGFKAKAPKSKGKPHNIEKLPKYVIKVEALLADMSLSWAYAESIAKNLTGGKGYNQGGTGDNSAPGVDRLAWMHSEKDWVALIGALHVEQEKRNAYKTVSQGLALNGVTEEDVEALLKINNLYKKGWRRNLRLLKAISQYYQLNLEG